MDQLTSTKGSSKIPRANFSKAFAAECITKGSSPKWAKQIGVNENQFTVATDQIQKVQVPPIEVQTHQGSILENLGVLVRVLVERLFQKDCQWYLFLATGNIWKHISSWGPMGDGS